MSHVILEFALEAGGRTIEASARVPTAPVRVLDVLPVLLAVDGAIVEAAIEQAGEAGQAISCRAGCGACCRQIVPISETEARYISETVASMPPERQARVKARFEAGLRIYHERGIAERIRAVSEADDPAERLRIGLEYFRLGIACPFLEEESCGIYPHRPMACREYLVSSPARNCSDPSPETVQVVPLPGKPSRVMYRFGDGLGRQEPRYLPLLRALAWTEENDGAPQPVLPGPKILENFLREVAGDSRRA